MKQIIRILAFCFIFLPAVLVVFPQKQVKADSSLLSCDNWQFFPATGMVVTDPFMSYWKEHGGLSQFGYPVSMPMQEVSALDGKLYTVQYFERAVFEYHPDNEDPYKVLLSQLGRFAYMQRYPNGAEAQKIHDSHAQLFPQTGFHIGGEFLTYWYTHGNVSQQGYPISEEIQQIGLDGKSYTMQYFERAIFEFHPENQNPYRVLLSQLGTALYVQRYGGWTNGLLVKNNDAFIYSKALNVKITFHDNDGSPTFLSADSGDNLNYSVENGNDACGKSNYVVKNQNGDLLFDMIKLADKWSVYSENGDLLFTKLTK